MDNRRIRNNKKRVTGSKNNAQFYIYTLVAAVIVCIVVSLVAFKATAGKNKSSSSPVLPSATPSASPTDIGVAVDLNIVKSTGVIEKINGTVLSVYDILKDKDLDLNLTLSTVIEDSGKKPLVAADLTKGSVVDFTYEKDSKNLLTITKSPRAWEHSKVDQVTCNSSDKTLTLGNNSYKYSDKTVVDYDKGDFPLGNITPYDTLTMSGYGDNVYYVKIEKGHGTIEFLANDQIKNGSIDIDTTQTISMNALQPVIVQEGPHRIVVKGDNITPYSQDIYVNANETKVVDLSLTQVKKGLFTPVVNVQNYTLTIDDIPIDKNEPILLPYGLHKIKVEKDGYIGFEDSINIQSDNNPMKIDLSEKVLLGKVKVITNPPGADIYVDSVLVGKSPVEQNIEYGTHQISTKMQGYLGLTFPVDVSQNTKTQSITLTPSTDVIPTAAPSPITGDITNGNGSSLFGQ